MRISEIITIYLAIGAPFGVYFFVQSEKPRHHLKVILKAFGVMIFFPLLSFKRFRQVFFNANMPQPTDFAFDSSAQQLDQLQRRLREDFSAQSKSGSASNSNSLSARRISLFDFLEVLERYVGLTSALNDSAIDAGFSLPEKEIFQIAGRTKEDLQLAALCLHRRNLQRLQVHQLQARSDFLKVLENLPEKKSIQTALEIAKILLDDELQKILLNRLAIVEKRQQNETLANVKQQNSVKVYDGFETERELWKPATSQLPINPTVFSTNHQSRLLKTQIRD